MMMMMLLMMMMMMMMLMMMMMMMMFAMMQVRRVLATTTTAMSINILIITVDPDTHHDDDHSDVGDAAVGCGAGAARDPTRRCEDPGLRFKEIKSSGVRVKGPGELGVRRVPYKFCWSLWPSVTSLCGSLAVHGVKRIWPSFSGFCVHIRTYRGCDWYLLQLFRPRIYLLGNPLEAEPSPLGLS